MDYDSLMERLDKIETTVEFSAGEILQQRGTMIGRWLGVLYGMVAALILVNLLGI